jgi:hypothetical protein
VRYASDAMANETFKPWLLDADPSIRWQVMRDVTREPDEIVAAERSRVASDGWGARLLALQRPDGTWSARATPKWECTLYTLLLLRAMGIDPTSEPARKAVTLVRDGFTFSFPTNWHYDVLRGLDYLRSAGVEPDPRVTEAVAMVAAARQQDGRWPLHYPRPEPPRRWNYPVDFEMEGGEGRASRWNTLRALRVLDWSLHSPIS